MASGNDTAATPPPAPRPSVFISYASEDRAAARRLRDHLQAGGLEVWYDEQELGGGDAWDQKIRRQIRDCEYFMPLISAATQARKEGYFRREWRLATERTLDMADDVLFLLPISIDETSEVGARVPDKFLHVQWLRLPGGEPSAALDALIRRILAGDHHALTRAPFAAPRAAQPHTPNPAPSSAGPVPPPMPPPMPHPGGAAAGASAEPPSGAHHNAPPPMPPFPHVPERGSGLHGIKFLAEVIWWALTAGWLIFNRLPRWFRIILTIWAVISLFSRCGNEKSSPPPESKPAPARVSRKNGDTTESFTPSRAEIRKAMEGAAAHFAAAQKEAEQSGTKLDLGKVGAEIARALSKDVGGDPGGGKPLLIVPFAHDIEHEAAAKFATAVFTSTYGQILLARPRSAAIADRIPPGATEAAMQENARNHGAKFLLLAQLAPGDGPRTLVVRQLRLDDGTAMWTDSFLVDGTEPTDAADKISEHVLGTLPARPPGPPKR